ncbi:MAG: metalloregulator ArsR/SmtB family transcription factor [Candidatus Eisenbacteria bacterium]|nr:metalloregulator ArsR/SmtB family transcription factor [Candidatus Eisenbacteria bacterium]
MNSDQRQDRNFTRDARVLKALASEPRLRIVERLSRGPECVCELTELLGSDQSTVSRHLGVLRSVGIVAGRREGQHVYYRLLTPCVLSFLGCAALVEREGASSPDDEA